MKTFRTSSLFEFSVDIIFRLPIPLNSILTQNDTVQPARFMKSPLNINPFSEKASTGPHLEWSKCAAIVKMAEFAEDGIEVWIFLRDQPEFVDPPEPVLEVKKMRETDAQRKIREARSQEKRVGWENRCLKSREKGVLCNSVAWDEADANVGSYLFLWLGTEGQRQVQQKCSGLDIQSTTTKSLVLVKEVSFKTEKVIAFKR